MRVIGGILGLVLVAAIVYYVYSIQFSRMERALPPAQQIDLVGVRSDLISIAQSERIFLATNGSYGTLEQLQRLGSINSIKTGRRGYTYEVEIDGARRFRIVARPADPARADWPTLSIDETMQISSGIPQAKFIPGVN